jgi:pimeloyl-ACP methyl ester carboxylesterase
VLEDGEVPGDRAPTIQAPTLVIHGTADPIFALAHGDALVDEIPDATLVTLEGAGHLLDPADWDVVAQAILEHTAPAA